MNTSIRTLRCIGCCGFMLLALCLVAPFTQAQQVSGSAIVAPDSRALALIKAKKAYLIDVRTPEEYATGHLANATNINFNGSDFGAKLAKLDKGKPVYLYCRSGNRSGKSTDTLQRLGFKEYYNIGGFEKLKEQGLPVDRLEQAAAGGTRSVILSNK